MRISFPKTFFALAFLLCGTTVSVQGGYRDCAGPRRARRHDCSRGRAYYSSRAHAPPYYSSAPYYYESRDFGGYRFYTAGPEVPIVPVNTVSLQSLDQFGGRGGGYTRAQGLFDELAVRLIEKLLGRLIDDIDGIDDGDDPDDDCPKLKELEERIEDLEDELQIDPSRDTDSEEDLKEFPGIRAQAQSNSQSQKKIKKNQREIKNLQENLSQLEQNQEAMKQNQENNTNKLDEILSKLNNEENTGG